MRLCLWLASVVLFGLSAISLSAQTAGDKKKHPHHHLHHALWELRDAHKELKASKHDFGGHKDKGLVAIKDAIKQIEVLLKHAGDNVKGVPTKSDLKEIHKTYAHHPHLHHAVVEQKHAHKEVKATKHDFGGHREAALKDINHAIHELQTMLKHPPKKV